MSLKNKNAIILPDSTCPITLESISDIYRKNPKNVVKLSDNVWYEKKSVKKWIQTLANKEEELYLPSRVSVKNSDLKKLSFKFDIIAYYTKIYANIMFDDDY